MKKIWKKVKDYKDIEFEKFQKGIARITINRPEVHNAFRPLTVKEMKEALDLCREDRDIAVLILRGKGTKAFCSGGDQRVRKRGAMLIKRNPPAKYPRCSKTNPLSA